MSPLVTYDLDESSHSAYRESLSLRGTSRDGSENECSPETCIDKTTRSSALSMKELCIVSLGVAFWVSIVSYWIGWFGGILKCSRLPTIGV